MFEALGEKFEGVLKRLRGEARLTEENIREAMGEVRLALLDADVNFKVVKDFMKSVTEKAVGAETMKSLRPGQQIVKIVYDELVAMMGGEPADFSLEPGKLQVILLLGLQGSGKTTFSGKLSRFLQKKGFKPLLVACDIYRPAAVKQLHVVGGAVGVPVFDMGTETPAPAIARAGVEEAKKRGCDLVIVDTAGRLHIDEVKMEELAELKSAVAPRFTFLVADAMTGQDAVNSARAFHEGVGIDGVCLTKIDGDARGGAALSIRAVTERPIYFVGTGEKPDDLEPFYPDRVASRILGMGDVLSLVERAQETIDADEALAMQKKMKKGNFTLQDFLDHMAKVQKMGPLKSLLGMIPGLGSAVKDMDIGDDAFKPMEAIIRSMTPAERDNVESIDASRRRRIAAGSGTNVEEVNHLLKDFQQMRKVMQAMMGGAGAGGLAAMMGGAGGRAAAARGRHGGGGGGGNALKQKPKHRRIRKTKKNRRR